MEAYRAPFSYPFRSVKGRDVEGEGEGSEGSWDTSARRALSELRAMARSGRLLPRGGAVELVLYLRQSCPVEQASLRSMERLVAGFGDGVSLVVRDVATQVEAARADRIPTTPTVVVRASHFTTKILGDSPAALRAILLLLGHSPSGGEAGREEGERELLDQA